MIEARSSKLAVVGLDLGRGPTPAMMDRIRAAVASRGITQVLICGSHTHHGPVIELTPSPVSARGSSMTPWPTHASFLIGSSQRSSRPMTSAGGKNRRRVSRAHLNRNRQTKRPERPTDPRLTVIRFDRRKRDADRRPGSLHSPPGTDSWRGTQVLGGLSGPSSEGGREGIEGTLPFHPGRGGRSDANPPEGKRDPKAYGELLAQDAVALAADATSTPKQPSLAAKVDEFRFSSRVNFKSAITFMLYAKSFFPELIRNFVQRAGKRREPRDEHGRAQRRAGDRRSAWRAFGQHAVRLRSGPISRSCWSSATAMATCSTFRPSRRPPRGAMVPIRRSRRSRSAQGRP